MHGSVMRFGERVIKPEDVTGKHVIEVGSYNVNGSLRGMIEAMGPASYLGIDQNLGPNVDVVANIQEWHSLDFEDYVLNTCDEFDLVVSTEVLEHCEDWRAAVKGLKSLVKPGGVLILTARGPGMVYHPDEEHGPYGDFWRFTVTDIAEIFGNFIIEVLEADPELPGFLMRARKPLTLESIEVARAS